MTASQTAGLRLALGLFVPIVSAVVLFPLMLVVVAEAVPGIFTGQDAPAAMQQLVRVSVVLFFLVALVLMYAVWAAREWEEVAYWVWAAIGYSLPLLGWV